MGSKLKVLAFLLGLVLVQTSAWLLSLLLFAYAFSGFFVGRIRKGNRAPERPGEEQQSRRLRVSFKRSRGSLALKAAGLVFIALSLVAFESGGTDSPIFFGGIGVLLIASDTIFGRGGLAGLSTEDQSVLLRSRSNPFHWFALAEMKLATRYVGKALAGVNGNLLIKGGDKPSIIVVFDTVSPTHAIAREALVSKFRELVRISGPLGAYVLPLDAKKAATNLLNAPLEQVELDTGGWPTSLSSTDYDLLSINAKHGLLSSITAYRTSQGAASPAKVSLPTSRHFLSRPTLLWEAIEEVGKKIDWPKPDEYTTFLSSMFATRGESLGERIAEAGRASSPSSIVLQSLGSPPVEMSRSQLRAIADIYD